MNVHVIPSEMMLDALEKNWSLLLIRGLLAILFGILAIVWPGLTLIALVMLFSTFALADGVVALFAAIQSRGLAPRWLAIVGVAGIVFGALALHWPQITGLVLLWLIAGWSVAVGVMHIVGAIHVRKEIKNERLLIACGILSMLFGIVLFLRLGAGALGLTFAIGVFAIAYGMLLTSFAFRLHIAIDAIPSCS